MSGLPHRPSPYSRSARNAPTDKSKNEPYAEAAPEWRMIRQKFGRMQHRDGPDHDWQHIEDSYESERPKDHLTEPWNVEQVYFKPDGIEIHQLDGPYDPQKGVHGQDMITVERHSLLVRFRRIANIIISEYESPKPTAPQYKEVHAVIRFTCTSPAEFSIEVKRPGQGAGAPKKTSAEKEDMDVDEPSKDEQEQEAVTTTTTTDANTFPLAKAYRETNSFQGKEIRLTFLRGTSKRNSSYAFAWPGIVQFLTGSRYYNEGEKTNAKALNEWAPLNGGKKPTALLTRRAGVDEWDLQRQQPQVGSSGVSASGYAQSSYAQSSYAQQAQNPQRQRREPYTDRSDLSSSQYTSPAPPPKLKRNYEEVEQPVDVVRMDAASAEEIFTEQRKVADEATRKANELDNEVQQLKRHLADAQRRLRDGQQAAKEAREDANKQEEKAQRSKAEVDLLNKEYIRLLEDERQKRPRPS